MTSISTKFKGPGLKCEVAVVKYIQILFAGQMDHLIHSHDTLHNMVNPYIPLLLLFVLDGTTSEETIFIMGLGALLPVLPGN